MQPMELKRPWSKNPVARKFEEIVELREMLIRIEMPMHKASKKGKANNITKYLLLFKVFTCEIIELDFDSNKDSNRILFEVRNLLKSFSTIVATVTCIDNSHLMKNLFRILNDKKLIANGVGQSGNSSVLTKNGKTFLFLLEEYLYLAGEISKTSFTDERFNSPSHSRWFSSPTFEVKLDRLGHRGMMPLN